MKKRILPLILSLIMIFTMSEVNLSAMAKTTAPTITLDSVEAESGQDVSIKVSIENNPGIWGMDLKISYDKTALILTSVENGDFFQASEWTKGNLSADVYTLSYEASGFDDITTQSGTLATLNFKVSDTAVTGAYGVTASYNSGDIINVSFDDVNFDITDGQVIIKAKPVSVTGVSLDKKTLSLNTGDSETLIATVSPDNATNKAVVWESSDTTVVNVDSNGKVTAMKKGTATITVTTEDGSFTDTCEVRVACSHANRTTHPAADSTCLVQGNSEYSTCDDCGIVVLGSDEKLPFASHKGGTATCKDKAVCTVCKETYGDYTSHQLTNYPRNEATHSKAGNIEYWTCDVCGKYFGDAAGKNEIEQKDTIIDKVSHSYDTEWLYSGTQHWKECSCGAKAEQGDHVYDNACDTTCNAGCGYVRTITHQWKTTYSSNETKHWRECSVCGEKKGEQSHSGGTATCKDKAVCEVCDNAYGKLAPHNNIEKVDNTYLKTEATCVAKAVYYKSCSVCGTAGTETFTTGNVDDHNHTGNIQVKDAAEATCTKDGYSGDIYCKDCGEKLESGNKTEKATHAFSEWTVAKEASTTEKGRKERTCSVCGYSEVEEIPILETQAPQTGDYSISYLWIALLVISSSVLVRTIVKKKRI